VIEKSLRNARQEAFPYLCRLSVRPPSFLCARGQVRSSRWESCTFAIFLYSSSVAFVMTYRFALTFGFFQAPKKESAHVVRTGFTVCFLFPRRPSLFLAKIHVPHAPIRLFPFICPGLKVRLPRQRANRITPPSERLYVSPPETSLSLS